MRRGTLRRVRRVFQTVVVVAALVTGGRYAMGHSRVSVETFCPFGGLESALSLLASQRFTCAIGERNLALFLGLVILALMARRAFCGWVCPVGTLSEWIARLRGRARSRAPFRQPLPSSAHRLLRWARVIVLGAILWFTYRAGELVFRGFDPYYVLFSFHGHDVKPSSYVVVGTVLIGMLAVPMLWCRYLCPLGVALLPFSALGVLRIRRRESPCTRCAACDEACPHAIPVSTTSRVRSPECTLCLECLEACGPGALELYAEVTR